MLKMSGFEALFSILGSLYLLLALVAVCIAIWKGKTRPRKLIHAGVVLAVFMAPIAPEIYRSIEYRGRLAKASALFEERCKTAGEKVYKSVEGVEGVLLANIRVDDVAANRANPMWVNAALPNEHGGEWYVISFLGWEQRYGERPGPVNLNPTPHPGYRYVDVAAQNGRFTRYALVEKETNVGKRWVLGPGVPQAQPTRFSVGFENMVLPDDRKHWVASTRLTVVDTENGELLGERTSYSFEPGLGSADGLRQPWGFAIGCPAFVNGAQTRLFVEHILKPVAEKKQ